MGSNFQFIDIILLAMIAGFVFLRLRNVLGKKTGYQGKSYYKNNSDTADLIHVDHEKNKNIHKRNLNPDEEKHFLKGAKAAYETIITAFAKGDKKTLKSLLNTEMYEKFSLAIEERENKQFKNETIFIGVKSADIESFRKEDSVYKITVNFVSEIITCIKDKENNIVEGSPDIIKTAKDVWKFSKNMWSQNPTWYLVETLK